MVHSKRGFSRIERVKEHILHEIADLVRAKLKDPRIGFITITDIDLTQDYQYAKIYYTVLDNEQKEATQIALEHSKGFLRRELSRRINLFVTPQLTFEYDNSLERGLSISRLIEQVTQEKKIED